MTEPQVLRTAARADVDRAVDYYISEAGIDVGLAFVDALEAVYRLVREHPAAGSPCFAAMLGMAGLRSHPIKDFPYLVFYLESSPGIEVVRVLHSSSQISALMLEGE